MDFEIIVHGCLVSFLPQSHFVDRDSVRAASDPIARAWELMIALEVGAINAHLKYKNTEIVDRAPTPGVIELHAEAIASATAFGHAMLIQSFKRYPQPPDPSFQFTPDVDFLWQRYCLFKKGREPLLSMAYFVLTMIEIPAGGRRPAATTLNIEEDVLRKIGELTSTRGDRLTARKRSNTELPLEAQEQVWLEAAVKKLILQVGRSAAGPAHTRLSLADLPDL
ncbi:hypothetical protein [Polaromonas glacialis]|uniref:hypothetical protein n=1 Tax=Polaromonas glacialis TaxID=866564 RepID=UPI0012EC6C70|nr:hypothetical protein [Polaromonas glacialis]